MGIRSGLPHRGALAGVKAHSALGRATRRPPPANRRSSLKVITQHLTKVLPFFAKFSANLATAYLLTAPRSRLARKLNSRAPSEIVSREGRHNPVHESGRFALSGHGLPPPCPPPQPCSVLFPRYEVTNSETAGK